MKYDRIEYYIISKIKKFFNRDKWNHIALVRNNDIYSIYLNGSSDYVSIPDSDDWDFGTGDFTIDFWVDFKIFNPKTWNMTQQYAFSKHFYKV